MARSSGIFGSYDYDTPGEAIGRAGSNISSEMFKVAMLSKQMELEHQNRLSEIQEQEKGESEKLTEQHSLGMEKGSDLAAIIHAVNPKLDTSGLNSIMLPQGTINSALGAFGASARAEAMMGRPTQHTTQPDANNLVMTGYTSPMSVIAGNWIAPPGQPGGPSQTLNPKDHEEVNKIVNQVTNAQNSVNQISKLAQQILPKAPAGVPISQLEGWWNKNVAPNDPNVKAFVDLVGGLQAQYIKDSTGQAPRSVELMKMEGGLFPQLSDNAQSSFQKTQALNNYWGQKAGTALSTYDPSDFLHNQFHPMEIGKQSVNPVDPATELQKGAAGEYQRRQALKKATNQNGQ